MTRILGAALIALLLPGLAEARRVHVSPTGNNASTSAISYGTATWSGTPLQTLNYAINTAAISNDTLLLAAGTYSGPIAPTKIDGLVHVTVIGDSTNPYVVIVPGGNISAADDNLDFGAWAIIGVYFTGTFQISEVNGGGVENNDADGLLMRHCIVRDNFDAQGVDMTLYTVRVGSPTDALSNYFKIHEDHDWPWGEVMRINMERCGIYAGPANSTSWGTLTKAIEFWPSDSENGAMEWTASRCTMFVYAPSAWNAEKPTGFRALKNSLITDSRFELVDSSGTSTLWQGLLFRDNYTSNVFCRDTFITRTVRPGTGGAIIQIMSPGSNDKPYNESDHNSWRYCWFQSNVPFISPGAGDGTIGFVYQMSPGDTFTRNVAIVSNGTASAGFTFNNWVGNSYVGRNTFVNYGTGGAARINADATDCNYINGTITFENNILYSASTSTGADDYAMKLAIPNRAQPVLLSDYNLYAHYGSATGSRSVLGKWCGGSFASRTPGATGSLFSTFGNDYSSRHGSPRFTDSTYATFNANLLSNSAAIAAGRDSVDCGAMDYDRFRPYFAQDFRTGSATPTRAVLVWVSPGDDSLIGTCTSYLVRYSTLPIDESNWASATPVTGTIPSPARAGTTQSMIVTGLSSGSRYYFAMKAVDDVGYESPISGDAQVDTPTEGPEIADP